MWTHITHHTAHSLPLTYYLSCCITASPVVVMAQQALRDLQDVVKGPNRPVIYTPPEMIPQWQPAFADKLTQAVSAALQAGVAAEKVFTLLDGAAAVDLDSLPDNLLAMCVESGLCPDTDLGGESLLHFLLNTQFPVPLGTQTDSSSSDTISSSNKAASSNNNKPTAFQLDQQAQTVLRHLQDLQHSIPAQHHPACGSTTLAELLRRGATPNLTDSSGNTALHMVVACMVSKKHFPDPSVVDQRRALQQQQQQSEDEDGPAQPQSNGSTDGTQTPAGPKQLDDNDKARAAYGSAAFIALLQAGWDPAVRNANGYTVSDLMLEGLSRYQTGDQGSHIATCCVLQFSLLGSFVQHGCAMLHADSVSKSCYLQLCVCRYMCERG